jgi:hypothetical protein
VLPVVAHVRFCYKAFFFTTVDLHA